MGRAWFVHKPDRPGAKSCSQSPLHDSDRASQRMEQAGSWGKALRRTQEQLGCKAPGSRTRLRELPRVSSPGFRLLLSGMVISSAYAHIARTILIPTMGHLGRSCIIPRPSQSSPWDCPSGGIKLEQVTSSNPKTQQSPSKDFKVYQPGLVEVR